MKPVEVPERCSGQVFVVIVGTVVSVISFIIGTDKLVESLGGDRALKLAICSDAITDWNWVGRERFNTLEDASVSAENSMVNTVLQKVVGSSTDIDPLKEEPAAEELSPYIAAKYVVSGRTVIPQISWGNPQNASVSIKYLLHPKGRAVQQLTIPTVALLQVRVHKLPNAKTCKHMFRGSWVDSKKRCESYHRATAVCAAVEENSQGQWVVESGCGAGTAYVQYEQVPGKSELSKGRGLGGPPEGLVNTAAISIILRSSADPYLQLERRTKGKLEFGATQERLQFVGGSLVVIAVCLMVPCCVCLLMWRASQLKSPEAWYSEDYDNL